MSPFFHQDDVIDCCIMDPKHSSELPLVKESKRMNASYFNNIGFCKYVTRMFLSSANRMSFLPRSLYDSINRIILFSSKPKMFNIHTRGIVPFWTIVENTQPSRYGTSDHYPRRNMGRNGSNKWMPPSYIPMTKRCSCSSPYPALSSYFDFRPKSLWESVIQSLRSKVLYGNLWHSLLVFGARVTGPAPFLFCHKWAK